MPYDTWFFNAHDLVVKLQDQKVILERKEKDPMCQKDTIHIYSVEVSFADQVPEDWHHASTRTLKNVHFLL